MKALVVYGSFTAEDIYGRRSGARVIDALKSSGWIVDAFHVRELEHVFESLIRKEHDVVVPVGFGAPCEDGQIYAVARMLGIPCAGPTPAQGALMQDKSLLPLLMSTIFPGGGAVRSPVGQIVERGMGSVAMINRIRTLPTPLIVKPAFGGSSDGLCVAHTHEQAVLSAQSLLNAEGKVLVQVLERPEMEISCTVIDMPTGPQLMPIVELRRDDVLVMGAEEKFGASANDRHIVPARLRRHQADLVEDAVLELCRTIGPVGLTRTDMLVLSNGEIVVLEINGIPGLLETSIACESAAAAGISFEELCLRYARSAFIERPEPRMVNA